MSYEERRVGVFDRELQRTITPRDPEWRRYEAWLRAGNEPAPEPDAEQRALSARRREASARVNGARSEALRRLTVEAMGHTFTADNLSYTNLLGALLSAQARGQGQGFTTWRTADNEMLPLAPAQMQELLAAMASARERLYMKSWEVKARVAASDDPEGVDVVGGLS